MEHEVIELDENQWVVELGFLRSEPFCTKERAEVICGLLNECPLAAETAAEYLVELPETPSLGYDTTDFYGKQFDKWAKGHEYPIHPATRDAYLAGCNSLRALPNRSWMGVGEAAKNWSINASFDDPASVPALLQEAFEAGASWACGGGL